MISIGYLLGGTILQRGRFTGPVLDLNFLSGTLDSRVTFTRGTAGTFVGSNGLIQIAAINAPRFDYDPVTLAPRGLLIEEQRTNLLVRSNEFGNASWNDATPNTATVSVNAASPDGTTNGATITAATGGTSSARRQALSAAGATAYTFSIYIKQGTATSSRLLVRDNTNGTNFIQIGALTWSSGAPVLGSITGTWTSTATGNGWYRLTGTGTAGAGASVALSASIFPDSTAGTGTLLVYGAQLEAGAFATSYIPTVASTVTRSADVATMTGTNFSSWYNQLEGTIVWSGDFAVNNSNRLVSIDAGTGARTADIYGTAAGAVSYYKTSDAQQIQFGSGISLNTVFSAAVAIKLNDYIGAVNGTLGGADTTTGAVATADRLSLGHWNNTVFLNGHIRQIAYFNTRLQNARLQELTAPTLIPTLDLDFLTGTYTVGY